jgi:hypothetical protein
MSELDVFGYFIVSRVRDRVLEQNKMLLNGQFKGKRIQYLQSMVKSLSNDNKKLLMVFAEDLIDTAIHDLLFAIQDAHDRELGVEVIVGGKNIAETSGMLHGELLGEYGWIDRFSCYGRDTIL